MRQSMPFTRTASLVRSPTSALVSVDAFEDPDDIGLWCDVDGERMQAAAERYRTGKVTPLGAGPPGDIARLRRKPGGRRRLEMLAAHAHFIALSDEITEE